MKTIFESAIRKGGFDLSAMLERIDEYHIRGRLTASERDALAAQARSAADAGADMDVSGEIQRLWAAVRTLQAGQEGSAGEAPAFRQPSGAHDAYFAGDRITFGSHVYTCTAPQGVACVWSPDVMPDFCQAD